MFKKLLILLAILAVVIAAATFLKKFMPEPRPTGVGTTAVTYFQGSTKVEAAYTDSTVTFSHPSIGIITLPHAISASGARFANEDETIVFWNKGNEVTIWRDGSVIFAGSTSTESSTPSMPNVPTTPSGIQGKLPAGSAPAGDPALVTANAWVWDKTILKDGTVVVPNKPGVFGMTFVPSSTGGLEGMVNGTTDCNGFGGSYKIGSDGIITFGPFMSTLMFCEGSQESEFNALIIKVNRYTIDGTGALVLHAGDKEAAVYFKKK